MEHTKVDRELLVKKTYQLFSQQGYHSTTMEDIARACNIEKSSLYHHISSRKELLTLVIHHAKKSCQNRLSQYVEQTALTLQEQLIAIVKEFARHFEENNHYCLAANLVSESVSKTADITILLQEYFNECIKIIADVLSKNQESEQAKIMAEDIFAQIQGALLLSKIYQNPQILNRTLEQLTQKLSSNQ